eukprot:Skav235126  [mRNA]  locus=scaffold3581:274834:276423:- [translate_table: standard]
MLRTKIMNEEEFQPEDGDLYIPDDMPETVFQGLPVFSDRNMVLLGTPGSGKTTLYNKLTGLQSRTSNGWEACTQECAVGRCLAPAHGLQIVDTPGCTLNWAQVAHSLEVRKALTERSVIQIVAVESLPNNCRQAGLETALEPIDRIMSCCTFRQDAYGDDVCTKGGASTPFRTRVFLVLTHRDRFNTLPRGQWKKYIESIRRTYPWIGQVAMIDQRVSVEWLYNTIVLCAGFAPLCSTSHYIPMFEFFAKFPIGAALLPEHKGMVGAQRSRLMRGIQAARRVVNGLQQDRREKDLGPKLYCLIQFMESLYEETSEQAAAKLHACVSQTVTGTGSLPIVFQKWNRLDLTYAVKADFAPFYLDFRIELRNLFPESANFAAIYKKCVSCKAIYTRQQLGYVAIPCPAAKASFKEPSFICKPDDINGSLIILEEYQSEEDWNEETSSSSESSAESNSNGSNVGLFCRCVSKPISLCRKLIRAMSCNHVTGSVSQNSIECGLMLEWDVMPCVSKLDMTQADHLRLKTTDQIRSS